MATWAAPCSLDFIFFLFLFFLVCKLYVIGLKISETIIITLILGTLQMRKRKKYFVKVALFSLVMLQTLLFEHETIFTKTRIEYFF